MAISTYKTFLMGKASNSSSWEKVADIKTFGDLGGKPNRLETTTCSDPEQTFINGIRQSSDFDCTINYDDSEYDTILSGYADGTEHDFAIWFGGTESQGVVTPTGSSGKFSFKGEASLYVNGASVDEVVEATLSISRTSVVVKET